MKNLQINTKKKFKKMILVGALTGTILFNTACKSNNIQEYAITINGEIATIYEIKDKTYYNYRNAIDLELEDGVVVSTSLSDTKIIRMEKGSKNIEEIAASLIGPEGFIMYFGCPEPSVIREKAQTLTK